MMELPFYAYSTYYDRWYCPAEHAEEAQFVVQGGKLVCFVWDKYDIVETIHQMVLDSEMVFLLEKETEYV